MVKNFRRWQYPVMMKPKMSAAVLLEAIEAARTAEVPLEASEVDINPGRAITFYWTEASQEDPNDEDYVP